MNWKPMESVANAVLYEGYMLYPYRPSSVKNRQRWNFGVLYPRAYSDLQNGAEPCWMRTHCLIRGNESSVVDIRIRFLQEVSRRIGRPLPASAAQPGAAPHLEFVDGMEIGGKILQSWQEAIERDVVLSGIRLADLLSTGLRNRFSFSGARELEAVKADDGSTVAFLVRTRQDLMCDVTLGAVKRCDEFVELTVVVANATPLLGDTAMRRDEILPYSLLSAHTLLGIAGGEFVSLIDPPVDARELASHCSNVGTWPVLAGENGARDAMLSAPIILYDYPQVAPESPGDLFDGTEIDEILALRILTLSDDEKNEVRRGDDRARQVLERTESLAPEHFAKLHGALRAMKPVAPTCTFRAEDKR